MYYKLLGFSQEGSVRRFWFHRIVMGAPPVPFAVLVDTLLARKFNLSLQQLPPLCARLLGTAAADSASATMVLSEAEFSACAAENAAADEAKAAAAALRSHRSSLASKARGASAAAEVK